MVEVLSALVLAACLCPLPLHQRLNDLALLLGGEVAAEVSARAGQLGSLTDCVFAEESKSVVDLDRRALDRGRDLASLVAMMIRDIALAVRANASAPLLVVSACDQRGLWSQAGSLRHDYRLAALLFCVLALLGVLGLLSDRLDCALLSLVGQRLGGETTQRRAIGAHELHFVSVADVAALDTASPLEVICFKLKDGLLAREVVKELWPLLAKLEKRWRRTIKH